MSAMTAAMDAVLDADRALVTLLIEVQLPDHTIRLIAGSGVLLWNGNTFSGADPLFGTLKAIDDISDGTGDEAPALGFSLLPPSDTAAALLSSPTYQGSPVYVWLAGVYPTTGNVVPDPYLLFSGELDQPTLTIDRGQRQVDFDCVSAMERLLDDDEGARLSDAFHQSIWPGETGFANITGIEKTIYWGVATPAGALATGGSGASAGNFEAA
ncbi:hypothetical protein PQ455_01445 [Sphingomonas naphthae]|uniref:DUF2163 domain-containing protein n=1 Tax=Sphingomonas naphthae TaxID=1813468 RepID=A0ABY7TL39_9SPHN|nr:hypothetical protein [Sphingomonas naphthae]WCT73925.1 hypothetical protein PQ455_01445 [Sphingomonas naphthae]